MHSFSIHSESLKKRNPYFSWAACWMQVQTLWLALWKVKGPSKWHQITEPQRTETAVCVGPKNPVWFPKDEVLLAKDHMSVRLPELLWSQTIIISPFITVSTFQSEAIIESHKNSPSLWVGFMTLVNYCNGNVTVTVCYKETSMMSAALCFTLLESYIHAICVCFVHLDSVLIQNHKSLQCNHSNRLYSHYTWCVLGC